MLACTNMGLRPFQYRKRRTQRQTIKRSIFLFLLYILGYLIRNQNVPIMNILCQCTVPTQEIIDNRTLQPTVLPPSSKILLQPVKARHTVKNMRHFNPINASNNTLRYLIYSKAINVHHPTAQSNISYRIPPYHDLYWQAVPMYNRNVHCQITRFHQLFQILHTHLQFHFISA